MNTWAHIENIVIVCLMAYLVVNHSAWWLLLIFIINFPKSKS